MNDLILDEEEKLHNKKINKAILVFKITLFAFLSVLLIMCNIPLGKIRMTDVNFYQFAFKTFSKEKTNWFTLLRLIPLMLAIDFAISMIIDFIFRKKDTLRKRIIDLILVIIFTILWEWFYIVGMLGYVNENYGTSINLILFFSICTLPIIILVLELILLILHQKIISY
jgi:hypothetical protein